MRAGTVLRSISGQITRETDKAILLQVNDQKGDFQKSVWFPLSQLGSIHRTYDEVNGTFDVLMASEWILGQNGVLQFAGAAGLNPAIGAPVVGNPTVPRYKPPYTGTTRQDKANRLPYKDDDDPINDDIPF